MIIISFVDRLAKQNESLKLNVNFCISDDYAINIEKEQYRSEILFPDNLQKMIKNTGFDYNNEKIKELRDLEIGRMAGRCSFFKGKETDSENIKFSS